MEKINILMVDDREENLLALENLLDNPALNLVKAQSGNEALQAVLRMPFALVLLDVQMPEMDGFETAELMRLNPKTRNIPIIFLTALSREEKYIFRGYEAGAVDYIAKPIEPVILKSKVDVFCQLYRQRMEIEASRRQLAEANKELQARKKALEEDLELARSVQLRFLPERLPNNQKVTFSHYYCTCDQLGGDLFDVFEIDENHIGLYIADVAGHGVSAALLSGLLKMAVESFRNRLGDETGPAETDLFYPDVLIQKVNDLLGLQLPPDRFISMMYGVYTISSRFMHLVSAGHPFPLVYHATTGKAGPWTCDNGPAIGLMDKICYSINEKQLAPGDKILFYTDGITETMNATNEEFGEERLIALLSRHGTKDAHAIIQQIECDISEFRKKAPIHDDQTFFIFHVH